MNQILSIVTSIAIGMICYNLAKKRNKNPRLWFFIGLFFGVFGPLLFFIMSFKNNKKDIYLKNINNKKEIESVKDLWYYLDKNNNKFGPMSFSMINKLWEKNEIDKSSF